MTTKVKVSPRASRAKTSKFDQWLTKPEVAQLLGRANKTVDRLVTEGKLRKAYREVAGRKPVPVFDPASVEALRADREAGEEVVERAEGAAAVNARDRAMGGPAVAQVLTALAERADRPVQEAGLAEALRAIADGQLRMAEVFSQLLGAATAPRQLAAPAPEQIKLTLTLAEACSLSGLDAKQIKRRLKAGELRNLGSARDPRIPRADLEALAARPT